MKKAGFFLLFSVFFLQNISISFAQHDNNPSMSVSWLRMPARTTMCDLPDAAVYNPAGTISLPVGISLSAGNQFVFRKPRHTYDLDLGGGKKTFGSDKAEWLLPDFNLVYRKKSFAAFLSLHSPGSGIKGSYAGGSINTDMFAGSLMALIPDLPPPFPSGTKIITDVDDQSIVASSMYLATNMGVAYAINEMISFSAALRYLTVSNSQNVHVNVVINPLVALILPANLIPDTEFDLAWDEKANGIGYQLGANVHWSDRMNLAVRYDSKVKLELVTDVNTNDFELITSALNVITDGQKRKRDLPALLAVGASYKLTEKLRLAADLNYYFQKTADWDTTTINGTQYNWSELAGDALRFGLAASYHINPKLEMSAGISYSRLGYGGQTNKELFYTAPGAFEMVYDNNFLMSGGLLYHINKKFSLCGGLSVTSFSDNVVKSVTASGIVSAIKGQQTDINVETWNRITGFGLGIVYHFNPQKKAAPSIENFQP